MRNICARFSPQCATYVQDLCKIVLISPMRNICTRFVQDCTSFPNVQYMHKVCTRLYFFPQCTIYVQDLHKIVLIFPMRTICARLYFSPQCAIYAQDCRHYWKKYVTYHICHIYFFPLLAIYVQDCTSRPNAPGPLTIYAQNIVIQQVIKFSIFLFKLTGQTTYN